MKNGRWVTESARDKEADARQLAEKLLSNKACAGARVVRNWTNRDGTMTESVLFEKTQTVRNDGPVRINPIEGCPPRCEKSRDYFGLESRMTINRIFRSYLEQVFVTPTELLHSAKEMARLRDKDNLMTSAVDMVATLQTKGTELPTRQRRDELFAAFDQIFAQARRADGSKLPKIAGRFSDYLAKVGGTSSEAPEYLAMVALSRELLGMRSWAAKLDRLCKLAETEVTPQGGLLIDTVIADVLGTNAAQDILGWQPSLGSAIIAMLDLADGAFNAEKSEAREIAEQLNTLFGQGRLPGSRHVMIDRAIRQLKSTSPLSRNNPAKEMEEYQRVLFRLLSPKGLLAGADAAEALTMRGARFVEEGGATGRRAAMQGVFNALPDRSLGLMYLADLSRSSYGTSQMADIATLATTILNLRQLGEITERGFSMKDRMQRGGKAFTALAGSALPEAVRKQLTGHIDGLLERFVVDEKVVERLDNPESALRDRAMRLVQFCASGVLPNGRALALARKRVVSLLRQPGFDSHFVEGIADPAEAQKFLRDFHLLLLKAGFA